MEQALGVAKSLFGEDGQHTVELKRALGYMYRWDNRYAESEKIFLEAIATNRKTLGEAHGSTVDCILNLVELYWDQRREADADELLLGDFGGTRSAADCARVLEKVGEYFRKTGRLKIAERLLDESLAIRRRVHGDEHPETVRSLALLGELETNLRWIRRATRGPLLLEGLELARRVHGEDSPEAAHAARRIASDYGLLLGPPATLELLREASAKVEPDSEAGAIYAKSIAQTEKAIAFRENIIATNLEKFQAMEADGKGDSAAAAFHLMRAAYSEVALNQFEAGKRHLAQGLEIAPAGTLHDQIIAGWIAWRCGERQEAEEILLAAVEKHLHDPSVSSTDLADLLRNYLRPIWDGGDTSRFWEDIDRIEDEAAGLTWDATRTETIFPRGSRWFCLVGAPEGDWTAPRFDRELLWFRGQAPFHDFRTPAGKLLPFPASREPITTHFRSSFHVGDASEFEKIKLRLTRWSGAVVYLNGTEVIRHNVAPDAGSNATTEIEEPGGPLRAHVFELPATALQSGENTVAVAVYRYGKGACVYLDLAIEGLRR